jgi:hypothetical protein
MVVTDVKTFQNIHGSFKVDIDRSSQAAVVTGRLLEMPDSMKLTYVAAAPVEWRSSFTGSGLPFTSKDQAFHNTPNQGTAMVNEADRSFRVPLTIPGAYYVGLGTVLVPPTLFLTFTTQQGRKSVVTHVPVDQPVAFRFNTYPMQFTAPRASPEFYKIVPEPLARSQEAILRASAYPTDNVMPRNFWGTKPPV